MATDTTALGVAVQTMRDAVSSTEDMRRTYDDDAFLSAWYESEAWAGRALLAALAGVPERLAALEVVVAHRKVRRALSALEGEDGTLDLEDALAVLDGEGPG